MNLPGVVGPWDDQRLFRDFRNFDFLAVLNYMGIGNPRVALQDEVHKGNVGQVIISLGQGGNTIPFSNRDDLLQPALGFRESLRDWGNRDEPGGLWGSPVWFWGGN